MLASGSFLPPPPPPPPPYNDPLGGPPLNLRTEPGRFQPPSPYNDPLGGPPLNLFRPASANPQAVRLHLGADPPPQLEPLLRQPDDPGGGELQEEGEGGESPPSGGDDGAGNTSASYADYDDLPPSPTGSGAMRVPKADRIAGQPAVPSNAAMRAVTRMRRMSMELGRPGEHAMQDSGTARPLPSRDQSYSAPIAPLSPPHRTTTAEVIPHTGPAGSHHGLVTIRRASLTPAEVRPDCLSVCFKYN